MSPRLAVAAFAALLPSLAVSPADAQTVREAIRVRGCNTIGFETLSRQLAQHQACENPGQFVEVNDPRIVATSNRVHLFTTAETARQLRTAAARMTLRVNSAFRPVSDQFALFKRGGCPRVAGPGRSNHNGGRAVDLNNTVEARRVMRDAGLRWFGSADPVHYDGGGPDDRAASISAFQTLWNLNHPDDTIPVSGIWGPQTEARMLQTPMTGFARTACDAGGGCGDLISCLEGLGGLACFDEHPAVLRCGHGGGGDACFEECGGPPAVCDAALACWRSGGGGACFRPERCEEAERDEPTRCADLPLAAPELGLRRAAFLLACAANEDEVRLAYRQGRGALVQVPDDAARSLDALTPGHGRVDHVYVRGGGEDRALAVFLFQDRYEGGVRAGAAWTPSDRAALRYALDSLPFPHVEGLASEVVDVVRGGARLEWSFPEDHGEHAEGIRAAFGAGASAAADPAGPALALTNDALASSSAAALAITRVVGGLLETGTTGIDARAFPSGPGALAYEPCRVLGVPVPFCSHRRDDAEGVMAAADLSGPLDYTGALYQRAVGATEVLRDDAGYQRTASFASLYGEPGTPHGAEAAMACGRWALCGNEPSDADRDGVPWLPPELREDGPNDCSDINPANDDDSCGGAAEADLCGEITDCASCNDAVGCGFCGATGRCMADRDRGECSGDWQDTPSSCVDCSGLSSCDACVRNGFCGWCPGVGCVNDHSERAMMCGEAYRPTRCGD